MIVISRRVRSRSESISWRSSGHVFTGPTHRHGGCVAIAVEIETLTGRYLTRNTPDVGAGEFFSIIGPSGCGKSTLLRIIGGLLDAYSGELLLGAEPVKGPHPWIGMVFQEESTFPWRTVLANVEFGLEMRGTPTR